MFKLNEQQICEDVDTNENLLSTNNNKTEGNRKELVIRQRKFVKRGRRRKSTKLEEKVAKDETFDIIGIRNFSSTNLTDDDIRVIINQAFYLKKKLILD